MSTTITTSTTKTKNENVVNTFSASHCVQFYENEQFLYKTVVDFVAPAIENNEGIIIIATRAHLIAFEQHLRLEGFDIESAIKNGQALLLDAADTLSQFMFKGVPDAFKFNQVVGASIKKMSDTFPRIRAYGEMVNLLWAEGNFHGTLELEEMWNDLAKIYSFSLLCGYEMKHFNQQRHGKALHEICGCHSHVMPAERMVYAEGQQSSGQIIALLQQKIKALESEVASCKESKKELQETFKLHNNTVSNVSENLKIPLTSLELQLRSLLRSIDRNNDTSEVSAKIKVAVENNYHQCAEIHNMINQILGLTRNHKM